MSDPGKSGAGFPGWAGVYAGNSDYNAQTFLVEQLLALVSTATLVQVISCTVNDDVGPIGTVDVLPLVNMTDGLGKGYPNKNCVKLPYARVQGGQNAVICDPVKGDIGVAVFADRDISIVKKTQAQAVPGSYRRYDIADGIYLYTVLSKAAPTQYVRFIQDSNGNPTGMELVDKNVNRILMDSAGIHINGVLIDRNRNVSNIVDITNSGNSNLSGASQAVKLADGSNSTKVKAT